MKPFLLSFALAAGVIVACAQIAPPPTDPSAWPCGDPRYEWCPGHRSCCFSNEICRPDGWCAANEEIPRIVGRQRVVDAGDARPE